MKIKNHQNGIQQLILYSITLGIINFLLFSPQLAARKEPKLEFNVDSQVIDRTTTSNSYSGMLKKVTPSVVSVYSANIVKYSISQQEEFLRRFYGVPIPRGSEDGETIERKIPQGVGSGVIISPDGYILTNNHVVTAEDGKDADEIIVLINNGKKLQAKIIGRDPRTDIALIKIDSKSLPAITIADSENIEVGDIVFAVGNPMGIGLTVTQGIISAKGRNIGINGKDGYEDFIQTDAAINPGNSGGALVDSLGRLIGINSAILSRTGGNIGIGFAIPVNLSISVADQLLRFGEVKRGYIGVVMRDLDPDMAEAFKLKGKRGIVINAVQEGLPAKEAGIKRGDVITAIDGRAVDNANDFRLLIGQAAPGDELTFTVYRNGKKKEMKITVGDQSKIGHLSESRIFEGVKVAPLGPNEHDTFNIPDDISGIVIVKIDPNSPYSRFFSKGMVIMEINDRAATDSRKAKHLLSEGINKLYIYDRGRAGYLAVPL